jgi:hypothetical protein
MLKVGNIYRCDEKYFYRSAPVAMAYKDLVYVCSIKNYAVILLNLSNLTISNWSQSWFENTNSQSKAPFVLVR